MSDTKKLWIDPNDCGLITLEAAERKRKEEAQRKLREEAERKRKEEMDRKRREEQAMKKEAGQKKAESTQGLAVQPKAEILPPASKAMGLPPDASATPGLDLAQLERQIRDAAKMLDLSVPEGRLDKWFGRPDHRIEVKTERGRCLAGYLAACTALVDAARKLQDARRQAYIDQLLFLQRVSEENLKLEYARRRAEREDSIQDAKAREIIADHKGKIREHGLRGRPAPPPPPPPPAPKLPSPEEVAELRRAEVRRTTEDRLAIEADAQEVAANAAEEKVTRAKKRCIAIYQDPDILAGEKHARIVALLDEFGYKYDILPRGVAEFIEEGFEEDENELT